MAARVGTVLSDEHVLKHCAHYQPIPMKLAAKILDGDSISAKTSPFTSKKLKYVAQLSRPAHFDSYARSIARNLGNDPEFRSRLHTAYTADIAQHATASEVPEPAPSSEAPPYVPPPNVPPPSLQGAFGFTNWEWLTNVLPALMRLEEQMNTPENQPDPRAYRPPTGVNAPFVSQYDFGEDPPGGDAGASNEAEGYESAQSASTDPVPDLEPDVVDEVGTVDANDPLPFGEPSESSEEEGPSSSTNPPRRSSRAGASRAEGFYSEANQAARGQGNDNFFFHTQ